MGMRLSAKQTSFDRDFVPDGICQDGRSKSSFSSTWACFCKMRFYTEIRIADLERTG